MRAAGPVKCVCVCIYIYIEKGRTCVLSSCKLGAHTFPRSIPKHPKIYIDRKRRQKSEELQNTEYLIRRREGGWEGGPVCILCYKKRERETLVARIRDTTKNKRRRHDPKCAPQAVKICTHG
jgi:hypothetical protein